MQKLRVVGILYPRDPIQGKCVFGTRWADVTQERADLQGCSDADRASGQTLASMTAEGGWLCGRRSDVTGLEKMRHTSVSTLSAWWFAVSARLGGRSGCICKVQLTWHTSARLKPPASDQIASSKVVTRVWIRAPEMKCFQARPLDCPFVYPQGGQPCREVGCLRAAELKARRYEVALALPIMEIESALSIRGPAPGTRITQPQPGKEPPGEGEDPTPRRLMVLGKEPGTWGNHGRIPAKEHSYPSQRSHVACLLGLTSVLLIVEASKPS